jgi:hypothetical protein
MKYEHETIARLRKTLGREPTSDEIKTARDAAWRARLADMMLTRPVAARRSRLEHLAVEGATSAIGSSQATSCPSNPSSTCTRSLGVVA